MEMEWCSWIMISLYSYWRILQKWIYLYRLVSCDVSCDMSCDVSCDASCDVSCDVPGLWFPYIHTGICCMLCYINCHVTFQFCNFTTCVCVVHLIILKLIQIDIYRSPPPPPQQKPQQLKYMYLIDFLCSSAMRHITNPMLVKLGNIHYVLSSSR